jgi:hypothetical protein
MTKTVKTRAVLHVGLPLVVGGASYLVMRSWVPLLGVHAPLWPHAPSLLRDHLADASWGWALGAFVTLMWMGERRVHRVGWTIAAASAAAMLELVGGTFDRADLVIQTVAVLLASVLIGGIRWTSASEAH